MLRCIETSLGYGQSTLRKDECRYDDIPSTKGELLALQRLFRDNLSGMRGLSREVARDAWPACIAVKER